MTGISKRATARIGGILAGAGFIFIGGVLIASSPALADNGPHVSNAGTTAIGSGPDGCAGCHRAHSADGQEFLLRGASDETTLCTTCHGTTGTGASTDVVSGLGYSSVARVGTPGALRGGGFTTAAIGSGNATRGLNATQTGTDKTLHVIPAAATATTTTSKHALGVSGTMWGSGALNSGAGATMTAGSATALQCGSCHDPHGNGNYRILKPAGALGTTLQATPAAIASVSVAADTFNAGRFVFTYTTTAAHGLMPGQPVNVTGAAPAGYNVAGQIVTTTPSTTTFTIPNQAADPGAMTTGGTVSQAFANSITSAVANGTSIVYTTAAAHGMIVGQKVSVAGVNPVAYNLSRQTITAVTTAAPFTFTVANALPVTAYVSGGYVNGIPDAVTKVYTQDNFWRADDHNYTGTFATGTGTKSAMISNISQWCSTCHTRYFAGGSNARKFDQGDTVFKFRHTSANGTEGSANCLQCHVAHGSNAVMDGQFSSSLPEPGAGGVASSSSRLLRMDNRGICNMCHANQ